MYTPWSLRTRKIWLHNDVVQDIIICQWDFWYLYSQLFRISEYIPRPRICSRLVSTNNAKGKHPPYVCTWISGNLFSLEHVYFYIYTIRLLQSMYFSFRFASFSLVYDRLSVTLGPYFVTIFVFVEISQDSCRYLRQAFGKGWVILFWKTWLSS